MTVDIRVKCQHTGCKYEEEFDTQSKARKEAKMHVKHAGHLVLIIITTQEEVGGWN